MSLSPSTVKDTANSATDTFPPPAVTCPHCGDGWISHQAPQCSVCGTRYDVQKRILTIKETETEDFPVEAFRSIEYAEKRHFWYTARNLFIVKLLQQYCPFPESKTFLEIGCGTGIVTKALEAEGWHVAGVDPYHSALLKAERRTNGWKICAPFENVSMAEPVQIVGMFDLLEHLSDEKAILSHVYSQLEEGGFLILTVPANRKLWSRFDKILGHKRRYSSRYLVTLLEETGFRVMTSRYIFSWALLPVWLQRKLLFRSSSSLNQYLSPPSPLLNRLFFSLSLIENRLVHSGFAFPFGTSLIAVARKKLSPGGKQKRNQD